MKKRTLLGAALGILVGGGLAYAAHWTPCFGGATYSIHMYQDYPWARTGVPNSPQAYFNIIGTESNQWKNGTCMRNAEGATGVAFLVYKAQAYGETGWVGLWVPNSSGNCHFNGGEARLNRTYLDTAPSGWVNSTACHETGHALGLNHRTGSTSCMVTGAVFPVNFDGHDTTIVNQNYQNHGDGCL